MKKPALDDSAFSSRPLTELPLWKVEPQSVASGGSPDGAEKAKQRQSAQCDEIMDKLAVHGCVDGSADFLTREELETWTGIPATTLCARLGPSGPLQMQGLITATEKATRSRAGIQVIGYQLTRTGCRVVAARGVAA